jgi:hypothetical protein
MRVEASTCNSHILDYAEVRIDDDSMASRSKHLGLHNSRSQGSRNGTDASEVNLKSLQELDEAIASVKDACVSPCRPLSEENLFFDRSNHRSSKDNRSGSTTHARQVGIGNDHGSILSKFSLDAPSNHSRTSSRAEKSTWSCSRSRASTRSRSRSRSRLRKELNLERTVRTTILEAEYAMASSRSVISNTAEIESSDYSTDDILKDLICANAVLVSEILSSSSRQTTGTSNPDDDGHIRCSTPFPSHILRPPISRVSKEIRSESPQRRDRDLLHRTKMSMLPPILSQLQDDSEEDDASWLLARAAEPIWATKVETWSSRREAKKKPEFDKQIWSPWCQGESFDEWGFEDLVFPTTTASTADITSSSKSSCVVRPEDSSFSRMESKVSNDSDGWTNFDQNTFNYRKEADECSHHSPSSVVERNYDDKTCSSSTFSAEAAWRRRRTNREGRIQSR